MRIDFTIGILCTVLGGSTAAMADDPKVLTSFPSSFPSPDGLAFDGEFLWATDCSTSRIDKVDPTTGNVVGSIDVKGVNSDELAWDGEALWMSDHTATEMPEMPAPAPALYRVDPITTKVLAQLPAPGDSKYPMGLGFDGKVLFNVDPWDALIFVLDPETGTKLRTIPAPAEGACGMTWDGACLWVSNAATDGLVYHLDPQTGEVIRSFPGPGGKGHQSTGVAWDGRNLWVHDEAVGRAKIYKLDIGDITEGGRCAGAFQAGADAGAADADAGDDGDPCASTSGEAGNAALCGVDAQMPGPQVESDSGATSGCTISRPRGAGLQLTATSLLVLGLLLRTRRRELRRAG